MTVAFPSHETGGRSSTLSVHTPTRLPFDLRHPPVRGIQVCRAFCASPRLREFTLMILPVTNDRGRHVHRRNCDRHHIFYTRIDLLQLAAEFLSMPNDWLRREFKVFSVRQAIVSYPCLHYLSALSSHKKAEPSRFTAEGLPPTSRIAVREIAGVWPMLNSISHTMRCCRLGWRQESGTFPALEDLYSEPLAGS
jgi:hypothetical protein